MNTNDTMQHLKTVLHALTQGGTQDLTHAVFRAFLHVESVEGKDAMLPEQYKGLDHA